MCNSPISKTKPDSQKRGIFSQGTFTKAARNSSYVSETSPQPRAAKAQSPTPAASPRRHRSVARADETPARMRKTGKDFVSANKTNLKDGVMSRLHPSYDVWNGSGGAGPDYGLQPSREQLTLTEKKNALIDAMQKRISGQSKLNAIEILASAGI